MIILLIYWIHTNNTCTGNESIIFCVKIYTGPYQAPASRGIRMDDNYLEALKPDVLVAVYISNYKKKPVIGKVTEVCDTDFTLNYWKGTYSTQWQPHLVKGKDGLVPWSDRLPKDSIIMCAFELDSKNHLLENTRKYLKRWYKNQAQNVSE